MTFKKTIDREERMKIVDQCKTTKEAAKKLGISMNALTQWLRREKIPHPFRGAKRKMNRTFNPIMLCLVIGLFCWGVR